MAPVVLLTLLGGCSLLVEPPRLVACEENQPDRCEGNDRVRCEQGWERRIPCGSGGCHDGRCVRDGGADLAPDTRTDSTSDSGDSGVDTLPSSRCTPWPTGFGLSTPVPVTELNSDTTEQSFSLMPDGRTAYFSSARGGGVGASDVYVATRTTPTGPFQTVSAYKSINTADEESQLSLSADGLVAMLATTRPGGAGLSDIWIATRASTAQPFTSATFFPAALINTDQNEWDPFLSPDGLTLYYQTTGDPKGMGGAELLVSQRPNVQSPFKQGTLLDAVNSSDDDGNPAVSADGLVLVFASTRSGGPGKSDIYYATRASATDGFNNPQLLPNVNTADAERDPFLTPDGCTLYFVSDRPGGKGKLDIYRAELESP